VHPGNTSTPLEQQKAFTNSARLFAASPDETHHGFDEYTTPVKDSFKSNISQKHVPAQPATIKNPLSHTSKNVQSDIPECSIMLETFNKLETSIDGMASTGGKSMLASKPLLRKTGGRDIYDRSAAHYLFTSDKDKSDSTEYLGKDVFQLSTSFTNCDHNKNFRIKTYIV
jgi:hypothetical protein